MNNYVLFSKGEQGDDGEVGLPGKPGNRGTTGAAGHPGIQGFSGPKVIALKSAIQLSSDSFATVYWHLFCNLKGQTVQNIVHFPKVLMLAMFMSRQPLYFCDLANVI